MVASGSVPGSPVALLGGSGVGATINETYVAGAAISIAPTTATALNLGNSGSTTNILGAIQAGGTAGVTCSGVTAGTVTVKNGIVTHC